MNRDFVIRDATPADLEVVVRFNAALASETEHLTLNDDVLRAGVRTALQSRDICYYWVAERDGVVIGQCMATFEWSDWRNGWLWWFQSVYVHPDHRRSGVFRALYEHVEAEARRRPDVRGLRLYVEQANARAMATYRSLGMSPSGHVVYEHDWSGG